MRSTLARWFLLVTAVALVLLGRPTEQLAAQRYDDEQASRASADDVTLHSERRHLPVIRLASVAIDDADVDVPDTWRIDVLAASTVDLGLGHAERATPRTQWASSISVRGPPAIRS